MKLSTDITESNFNGNMKDFQIIQNPAAFKILSTSLYSNPILAIIRELICNAYDAQVEAGNPNTPIKIIIPNYSESSFSIRDYGVGLSEEQVETLYTTFFWSTKSNSNDLTGGFGLGSKTPFAYADIFTVTSYYNGKIFKYACIKKDSKPTITKLGVFDTDEPNGLEITIPVRDEDKRNFQNEFNNYIKYMPEIKVTCERPKVVIKQKLGNATFYNDDSSYYRDNMIYFKQGQNVYPVRANDGWIRDYFRNPDKNFLFEHLLSFIMVLEVPIGTLTITPSREQLELTKETKETIFKILDDFNITLKKNLEENIQTYANTNMQRHVSRFLKNKYIGEHKLNAVISFEHGGNVNNVAIDYPIKIKNIECAGSRDYITHIYPDKKYLMVITDNFKTHGGFQKFKDIIKEYDFSDYDEVLLLATNTLNTGSNTYKYIINTFNILNSITEFNYIIDHINFNKFIRTHPIAKKPRQKTAANMPEDRNVLARTITSRNIFNSYMYRKSYSRTSIRQIKRWHAGDTLVAFLTPDEFNYKEFSNYIEEFEDTFCTYLYNTYGVPIERIVFVFFKNKDVYKISGLPIFNPIDFASNIKSNSPKYVLLPYETNNAHLINKLLNTDVLNEKEKNYIKNTKLYKYCLKLIEYEHKFDDCLIYKNNVEYNNKKEIYQNVIKDEEFIREHFREIRIPGITKLQKFYPFLSELSPRINRNYTYSWITHKRDIITNLLTLIRSF